MIEADVSVSFQYILILLHFRVWKIKYRKTMKCLGKDI